MAPTVRPTDATLGAVVTGVDLARLADDAWRALEDAFHEHAVLIFPEQGLTSEQQVAFAERFGEIEILTPGREQKAVPISNVKPGGAIADASDEFVQILRGNEGWHTDSSYMPLSAKASVLSAHVVPSKDGQTEWADMRAAWDALDDATRERVAGLSAFHSLYHSQAKIGHEAKSGGLSGFHREGAPLRPLVKVHPVTGRKALYVGRHAYGIPGLSEQESARLLDELVEFACRPPRVLQHEWRVGDVVVWDNRCVLHRARPYDYGEPRVMVHTRVAGDPKSEWAETHADHR
ncbi:MAG: TauD/TfdA dioxygenase family protein [Myxococcota bacterium]